MTDPAARFRVAGLPIPQGSKTSKMVNGKTVLYDDNGKVLKPWRRAVDKAARASLPDGWKPLDGPLRVAVLFGFARPISHPKRRRTWPTGQGTTGDVDKLARAVLDACTTADVWLDDAQVVELHTIKDWCGHGPARLLTVPGAVVRVWRIHDESPTSGQIPLLAQPVSGGTA